MNDWKEIKEALYHIVDSFLTEAKDQYGNDRSIDRLNQDRHLAVEALLDLIAEEKKKSYEMGQLYLALKLMTETIKDGTKLLEETRERNHKKYPEMFSENNLDK